MPDTLGTIVLPVQTPVGTFPLTSDYPHGKAQSPEVVVHRFGSRDAQTEQRYLLGPGTLRFGVVRSELDITEYQLLQEFWDLTQGGHELFYYNAPSDDGLSTTQYVVRFENAPISFAALAGAVVSTGITLVQVPQTSPTYALVSTLTRIPDATLTAALLSQVQTVLPLIKIQVRESGYPAIYVSDRRCTVGAQLYLARLLRWEGISQTVGAADDAQFVLGNADRVMTELANDTDLYRADLQFSLFHVDSGIKLDLWRGYINNWQCDGTNEFSISASDGIYELTLPYPCRKIGKMCWKIFDDTNNCPYTAQGSGGDPLSCDKTLTGDKGCQSHGMELYFGGHDIDPEGVVVKDNTTGLWGMRRRSFTSVSLVNPSGESQPLQEIYTDLKEVTDIPMDVNCTVMAGREEGDFYHAIGIVGAGPLGAITDPVMAHQSLGGDVYQGPQLDGQPPHGFGTDNPTYGWYTFRGLDPAGVNDVFDLPEDGKTPPENYTAGTAWVRVKRVDEKGRQLSTLVEHTMKASVTQGLSGWIWSAVGARVWTAALTNPIWIVINMVLRARGIQYSDITEAEGYFDVDSAVAASAICDTIVDRIWSTTKDTWQEEVNHWDESSGQYIVDTPAQWVSSPVTTEIQFKFRGFLSDEKPLSDWINEVLANCLGYFYQAFGKMKLVVRCNSSAVEAFTVGNILFQSLRLNPIRPSFNKITAVFGDEDYFYQNRSLPLLDEAHATSLAGSGSSPLVLPKELNLCGTCNKSQAARIIIAMLREELGGIEELEWKAAREISFKTTLLGLNVEPGMVCSMSHDDMPISISSNHYGEFRVKEIRYNPDLTVDIIGRTTTDSMYDMVVGPKPADVIPPALPPSGWQKRPDWPYPWAPNWERPRSGDVLFTAGNFGVQPAYGLDETGQAVVRMNINGYLPPNVMSSTISIPRIMVTAQVGGDIPAGVYSIAVCAYDSVPDSLYTFGMSKLSRPITVTVPANGKLFIHILWPEGYHGGAIYVGQNPTSYGFRYYREAILSEESGSTTDYSLTALTQTDQGPPDEYFHHLRVEWTEVVHGGIWKKACTAVGEDNIVFAGETFTPDAYVGRVISLYGEKDTSVPIHIANYRVVSNTADTIYVGVYNSGDSPIPALDADGSLWYDTALHPGDVWCMRFLPVVESGGTGFSDPLMTGVEVDEDIGKLALILASTGVGQPAKVISANTPTSWTLEEPWATPPDSDSLILIIDPHWYPGIASQYRPLTNGETFSTCLAAPDVLNLAGRSLLFRVHTEDYKDYHGDVALACTREAFVFGSQGTRAVASGYTAKVTDRSIDANAANGNIIITLPASELFPNQMLLVRKTDTSTHTVTIVGISGDFDPVVLTEHNEVVMIKSDPEPGEELEE